MINTELRWVIVGRTNPACGWCTKVKTLFESRSIDYTYIDIEEPGMREYFRQEGLQSVPQVWHYGTRIGGYEVTEQYVKGLKNENA